MQRGRDQAHLQRVFAVLEKAAIEGKRCPENFGPEGVTSDVVSALARAGRIKVEISGHNWRQVHILEGSHAGKSTAPNPRGYAVYVVVDKKGSRRIEI